MISILTLALIAFLVFGRVLLFLLLFPGTVFPHRRFYSPEDRARVPRAATSSLTTDILANKYSTVSYTTVVRTSCFKSERRRKKTNGKGSIVELSCQYSFSSFTILCTLSSNWCSSSSHGNCFSFIFEKIYLLSF